MAARKKAKKRIKKTGKKAKKAPAKKTKSKKAAKKTTKKTKKAAAKAPAPKKKNIGEGDYAASKSFLKDQSSFVKKNKAKIPALGKEAEKALEGPEGQELRDAEAAAMARSRDTF